VSGNETAGQRATSGEEIVSVSEGSIETQEEGEALAGHESSDRTLQYKILR
jgi:hypothetical protein